jgi:hypothetical protein
MPLNSNLKNCYSVKNRDLSKPIGSRLQSEIGVDKLRVRNINIKPINIKPIKIKTNRFKCKS